MPTLADLAPYAEYVLRDAAIPELPNHYRGKVRENYDLPDGRRILISTDRQSAFDQVLAAVPFKGQVLTETARFWFEATADICPNHVLDYPDPNVVVGRRLSMLPVGGSRLMVATTKPLAVSILRIHHHMPRLHI